MRVVRGAGAPRLWQGPSAKGGKHPSGRWTFREWIRVGLVAQVASPHWSQLGWPVPRTLRQKK